jgi:hypothetical protein
MKKHNRIKSAAVLWGSNEKGETVYSEILDIHAYYDGSHVWDEFKRVKKIHMRKLRGLLFDQDGVLSQEFENQYDANGELTSSIVKHSDGTVNEWKKDG